MACVRAEGQKARAGIPVPSGRIVHFTRTRLLVTGRMKKKLIRLVLAAVIALTVLLVPACEPGQSALRFTGPAPSPEVSAAVALAAGLL